MRTSIHLEVSKANREQSLLPTIYNVNVNQWLTIISEKAFMSWLKMHSWASNEEIIISESEFDEFSSLSALAKRLEIGYDTLNEKVLKPLWNVGLIDITEEAAKSSKVGERIVTIKLYKFPQNKIEKAFQLIEEFRNYDRDYQADKNQQPNKPLTILCVLRNHDKRIMEDEIPHEMIHSLFSYEGNLTNGLNEEKFADMLDKALTHAKEKIGSKGSAKGYFIAAIKRYKNKETRNE